MIAEFVKEIRDISTKNENITDIMFTPITDGYKISFVYNNDTKVKVAARVKGFFRKKLIIEKYVDSKLSVSYKAQSKEEISHYAELILS